MNNAWVENKYDIRKNISDIRSCLGVCPQFNTNLYSDLTVVQNFQFMCNLCNIPVHDHARIIEITLQRLNLVSQKYKKLNELSGGMQRRVAIGMSLLNPKAKLIILDEPTTGLDPHTKRIIWSNIKAYARAPRKSVAITGSSIQSAKYHRLREDCPGLIITSHDMDELNSICDEIAIMSAGQIVAQGTAI